MTLATFYWWESRSIEIHLEERHSPLHILELLLHLWLLAMKHARKTANHCRNLGSWFPPPPNISQSWGVLIKFCWQMWDYAVSLLSINQTFTKMQRVTLWIGGFLLTSWMEETFFIVDIISHNYLICKWEEKKMKVKTEVETATWNLNDKQRISWHSV